MEKKIAFDESELKNIEATYADGLGYNPFYSIKDAFRRHIPDDATITVKRLQAMGDERWGSTMSYQWHHDCEHYKVAIAYGSETAAYLVERCTRIIIWYDNDDHEETTDISIQRA